MDLILGPYSDRMLEKLSQAQLDAYESMLTENDIDLYLWYSGAAQAPKALADVLSGVQQFHAGR